MTCYVWRILTFVSCLLFHSTVLEDTFFNGTDSYDDLNVTESECGNNCATENISQIIESFKRRYPVELWKKSMFFTEDYIKEINVHWLKFSPPAKEHFYALGVLYVIIMIAGTCGNLLVIFMFCRCRSLRTPANGLIINLAVSDLMMMLMMPIFIYNSFNFGPVLGDIGCKFYGFLGGISGTVSICTLSAISFDRYYVVKFPLQRQSSYVRIKIFIVLAWIYGGTFSLIPVLNIGLGSYVPEGYLISCSYDYLTPDVRIKYFILSFFAAAWLVPFIVITFCYVNIVHIVLVTRNMATNSTLFKESSRHIKEEAKRKQELKLTIIVFFVIGMWFAAWTPYAIVSLLGIGGRADLISPFTSMVPALFCKSASCLDPYVYALTHPRFKSELRSLFCRASNANKFSRVWSISERRSTRRQYTSHNDDDVVVEIVMINLKDAPLSERRPVNERPFENMAISDRDMEKESTSYKPSWWVRPSFSNKSNIRKLLRSVSIAKSEGSPTQ